MIYAETKKKYGRGKPAFLCVIAKGQDELACEKSFRAVGPKTDERHIVNNRCLEVTLDNYSSCR